jgi:hypothetical protein
VSAVMIGISVLLVPPHLAMSQTEDHNALSPYVDFLGTLQSSAKDYILSLFQTHDAVVLCERHHPEITQYDLFLSVASDPRFIDSVGNIFTEVGTITQANDVNSFIHAEGLSADSVDRAVAHFQRNCEFFIFWEKTNYAQFVRGLYTLNQTLPAARKINLYNSDLPFDWSTINSAELANFNENLLPVRDSVIASQIVSKFDQIRSTAGARHKALVIMNYRHAFRHDTMNPAGITRSNVGRFLFDHYGTRFANVFINNLALVSARSDNDATYAPVQSGRWDAAFKRAGVKDAGFDFKGSPFGRDLFDLWPSHVDWPWQDEFDGFVFYLPLEEQKLVDGMPGFIDSAFSVELARRIAISNTVPGVRRWSAADIPGIADDLNKRREFPIDALDSVKAQIDRWLQ